MTWTISAFADEAAPDIDGQTEALQAAGYKHIDLRNVGEFNIVDLPVDVARQVKQKLDVAGISVLMFGSPIGKLDIADDVEIDLRRLNHLAALSDIFDARSVRVFSYYNKQQLPLAQWQREALGRLSRLSDLASRLGLVIYHENERHIFGDHLEQVLAISDHFRGHDSFKLIFDFDNYNQSGDDVWQNWSALHDHTDAFHLKDSTRDHMHVPVGQGTGQVKRILVDAVQRGWQGPLTLEPHLVHSGAMLATGPSGQANQALSEMSPRQVFDIAAEQATALLRDIGAPVA